LAEETFFRGTLYRLYERPGGAIGVNFAPILLLNAFIYLLPGLVTVLSDMWPWRLVYGLALAALCLWLRQREGSLAAPIAANVVFTVLFTLGGAQ
jgi:membrane protease YdiL (CAAX protease family)